MADVNESIAGIGGSSISRAQAQRAATVEDNIQQEIIRRKEVASRKSTKTLSTEQQKMIEEQVRKEFKLRDRLQDAQRIKNFQQQLKDLKTLYETEDDLNVKAELKKDIALKKREIRQAQFDENLGKMINNLAGALNKAVTNTVSKVDNAMNSYVQYVSAVNARVQGTDKSFASMSKIIRSNIGMSPLVSQQRVVENMANMIDQGILYNVEQRAFLQTIAKDIATTFDAANGTLLQLIRIQQADSTAARLGMEASMTKFLNTNFRDSSYLSQGYSGVTSQLLQSSALFKNYQDAIEFEYNVQKWLGSFGSLGVSSSTISNIAQAINYLGTGNIQGLQGNQGLLNLMAFASQRAGLDLGTMLNTGIQASQANALLRAIAQFGQEIGRSNSRVVMQQYSNLFGLDIADISALQNLTPTDFSSIFGSNLTYSGAISEVESQFKQVGKRQHIAQKISNVLDNIVYTAAGGIADNAVLYSTWRVASLLGDVLGDSFAVPVPFIGKISLEDTIKAGLIAGSLGMGVVSSIGSGLAGGGISLSNWGASSTLSRGQGKTFIQGGVSTGTSQSGFIGNADSAGIQNDLEKQTRDQAQQKTGLDEQVTLSEEDKSNWKNASDTLSSIFALLQSGALNVRVSNLDSLAGIGM